MTARSLCSAAPAAALVALATVTLAAHLPAPAAAATFLRAQATGHQVVPPNASPAFGSSFLQFDDASRQLTVNMTVGALTGTLLGARINGPALPGATGRSSSRCPRRRRSPP